MTQIEVRPRLHWAWVVAAVSFVALIGAAGFRATPGALIEPLQREFGWTTGTISLAVSINLMLYGLTAPFAAALMERFGVRAIVAGALFLVATGSGLTVFMTQSWQLLLFWGVLVGLGTGSMALAFVATITGRWFFKHRGLVTGVLTAAGATGQLVFLPIVAALAESRGWRAASLVVAAGALAVVPLALFLLREYPADLDLPPYGGDTVVRPPRSSVGAARRAISALTSAARTGPFWFLAGSFAICGATTNGLVGTHFIPAAHDHGMATTTAAGLLALVGVFDVAGTVFSGWLTDRVDSRVLLALYYALRGASLLVLPHLFATTAHPSMLVFIIFYGLDWVATVPPTVALCRELFGESGPVVFGWVFASHQIGAALAATAAGLTRDHFGDYTPAWYVAGTLSIGAAALSTRIRRRSTTLASSADDARPPSRRLLTADQSSESSSPSGPRSA